MDKKLKTRIAQEILLSKREIEEAQSELVINGLLFNDNIYNTEKEYKNIRLIYSAPAQNLEKNFITIGPFPMLYDEYKYIKNKIKEKEVLSVFLAFKKLQYEKTGKNYGDFKFSADEETIGFLASFIENYFEINNPFFASNIVWFYPKESLKDIMLDNVPKEQKTLESFKWWDIAIELNEDIDLHLSKPKDNEYIFIPNIIISEWYRYLPNYMPKIIWKLYLKKSLGKNFEKFKDKNEIIKIINEIQDEVEMKVDSPDRELLIKEIFDFNNMVYPIQVQEICDFLIKIGVIGLRYEGIKVNYFISNGDSIKLPSEILKIPKSWDSKLENYINTGSIILSYLDIDEIINK